MIMTTIETACCVFDFATTTTLRYPKYPENGRGSLCSLSSKFLEIIGHCRRILQDFGLVDALKCLYASRDFPLAGLSDLLDGLLSRPCLVRSCCNIFFH